MTCGEPIRVRTTLANHPDRSTAVLAFERRRDRVRPENVRGQRADGVAAQHGAGLVGEERAVAVAVGRDQRRQPVRLDPGADPRRLLARDGLGVDRHEAVASAQRDHLRPQLFQRAPHLRASRGAVLVVADPEPREASPPEEGHRARDVARAHARIDADRTRAAPAPGRGQRGEDAGLVGLGDLAPGAVELEAVAVEGDVAAGDHDRRRLAPGGLQRQRRRRHHAAGDRGDALGADRPAAGGGDAGRARPQVPPDQHLPRKRARAAQVGEKGAHVRLADAVRSCPRRGRAGRSCRTSRSWRPGRRHERPKSSSILMMSSSPR